MLRNVIVAVALLGVMVLTAVGVDALLDTRASRPVEPNEVASTAPPPTTAASASVTPSASVSSATAVAPAASTCVSAEASEPPSAELIREVARLQKRVRGRRDPEPVYGMLVRLPLAERAALRAFKDATLTAVEALVLETWDPDALDDATFERVFRAGGAVWSAPGDRADNAMYVSLRAAPGHIGRWVVEFGFHTDCGTDNVVAIFERRPLGAMVPARLAMVVSDDDVADIAGFRSALNWKISPPDADDRYYLAVAFTFPWCGSNWRSFQYAALEPASNPRRPNVLLHEREPNHFWHNGASLDPRIDGLTVQFVDGWTEDMKFGREARREWSRVGSKFHRARQPAVR